jgi:F420-non-reducing hydrogenase iron-sulfur subunit
MSAEFEPEVVVLYCQQSVDPGVNLANASRRLAGCLARFVAMPCSSKVEIEYLVKMLEQGADGIQVVGCPERTCRFLVGNTKAEKRIDHVRGLLEQIGFGVERVAMLRASGLTADQLMERARERADAVRELGPNPMKADRKRGG